MQTIDLRTGRPTFRTAKADLKALRAEDADIRTDMNARAFGLTSRILRNLGRALMLQMFVTIRPAQRTQPRERRVAFAREARQNAARVALSRLPRPMLSPKPLVIVPMVAHGPYGPMNIEA